VVKEERILHFVSGYRIFEARNRKLILNTLVSIRLILTNKFLLLALHWFNFDNESNKPLMSRIIEGYNYDIFISCCQEKNKNDWLVSEFVEALKTGLESTFKEEISVYFVINLILWKLKIILGKYTGMPM
jgi:hypothetical protein